MKVGPIPKGWGKGQEKGASIEKGGNGRGAPRPEASTVVRSVCHLESVATPAAGPWARLGEMIGGASASKGVRKRSKTPCRGTGKTSREVGPGTPVGARGSVPGTPKWKWPARISTVRK